MKILLVNPPHPSIGSRIPREQLPPHPTQCREQRESNYSGVGFVTALLSPRLRQPKGTPPRVVPLWWEYLGG
jgi:hypothetical protein